MVKKNDMSEAERALFREAMHDVKPLVPVKKMIPPPPRPKLRLKKPAAAEDSTLSELSDHENLPSLESADLVEFKRPGIPDKILRKLRGGQYNVEAVLDLHGMTVDEARDALSHFILRCLQTGICHGLIIHGKGRISNKPVLKNKLNHWLRQIEQILAFCSATPKNGHSGAMAILLKNQKGEKAC